jgi:hypothetical protein
MKLHNMLLTLISLYKYSIVSLSFTLGVVETIESHRFCAYLVSILLEGMD